VLITITKLMKTVRLDRLDSSAFDWLTWRNGTILDVFGFSSRSASILANKTKLQKHAVGWCPAEQLACRPKLKCKAVMFYKGDTIFWTHIRDEEFKEIWGG